MFIVSHLVHLNVKLLTLALDMNSTPLQSHKTCTTEGSFIISVEGILYRVSLSSDLYKSFHVLLLLKYSVWFTAQGVCMLLVLLYIFSYDLLILVYYLLSFTVHHYSFSRFWEKTLLYSEESWSQLTGCVVNLLKSLIIWLRVDI